MKEKLVLVSKVVARNLAKRAARYLARRFPKVQSFLLARWVRFPQPKNPLGRVVITVLTPAGPGANGKVSAYDFLPTFCDTLRQNGLSTFWASSIRELEALVSGETPVFIIHLFGEDNFQISSSSLLGLEGRAIATFNASETGMLLADKLASHRAFASAGIDVPALRTAGGFVRDRFGSGRPTAMEPENPVSPEKNDQRIQTDFIDTRVEFKGRQYYTTVRLLCVDGVVLHAYPRARDTKDGNPSVHARDTPVDAELIEYLDLKLIRSKTKQYGEIARRLFEVLGHGFYAHDLMVENESEKIFVCESGFKFDDPAFWRHIMPIASEVPSQSQLYPIKRFSRSSALVFLDRCRSMIESRK